MDIEERAEKWADERLQDWSPLGRGPLGRDDLVSAYLAGVAQAQKDYTA